MSKNGSLTPCPSYNGSAGSVFEGTSLVDFFQTSPVLTSLRQAEDDGRWHLPGCQFCSENPKNSAKSSFRRFLQETLPKHAVEITELVHLEIDFGNYCNLDCVMCSSDFSSKWLSSDIEYNQTKKAEIVRPVSRPWRLKEKHVAELLELSRTVESVHIKGGEPLLEKTCEQYLQGLCDIGAKQFELVLVTNFLLMNDRYADLLARFPRLTVNVSVDGVGRTYEWVRGYPFAAIETALIKYLPRLPHGSIVFNLTASAYNVTNLEEFYRWTARIRDLTRNRITIQFGPVVKHPNYLSPQLTSRREEALEQIARVESDPLGLKTDVFMDSLRALKAHMENVPVFLEKRREKFSAWHEFLVKKRGWDILKDQD